MYHAYGHSFDFHSGSHIKVYLAEAHEVHALPEREHFHEVAIVEWPLAHHDLPKDEIVRQHLCNIDLDHFPHLHGKKLILQVHLFS